MMNVDISPALIPTFSQNFATLSFPPKVLFVKAVHMLSLFVTPLKYLLIVPEHNILISKTNSKKI